MSLPELANWADQSKTCLCVSVFESNTAYYALFTWNRHCTRTCLSSQGTAMYPLGTVHMVQALHTQICLSHETAAYPFGIVHEVQALHKLVLVQKALISCYNSPDIL